MINKRAAFAAMAIVVSTALALPSPAQNLNERESVLTQHNNNARTGAYLAETLLKPSNVNTQHFGLLYTLAVDGAILAQPLFAKDLNISGVKKDVLYVATRSNRIYAFEIGQIPPSAPLWQLELPTVPKILDQEPITAVWRDGQPDGHLDLFATGTDGTVLSNFWDAADHDWHDWFAIRPDSGKTKPGTPQQITAVWGDPNNPQHLNLFMTDQNGTVMTIYCTLAANHPCWQHESWFQIGGTGIATPGQPVTAVWRDPSHSHLDLFIAGSDGRVLSNYYENNSWHDWFAIRADTGKTKPGIPQQITAIWGDPNNSQHLNLFMTDQNGTIKSIYCTVTANHGCWQYDTRSPQTGSWFSIGGAGIATPGQPVTALWRNPSHSHLDLFIAGSDGRVLGNYYENNSWHDWFAIRPDTGKTRPAIPQQITAIWGDPYNPEHLNLFMTDQNGTVKSIYCTPAARHDCWRTEAWFPIGQENGIEKNLTAGQPITAVWRGDSQFSHLDLFAAGQQVTGVYRDNGTNAIKPIPGQDPVIRPGVVLSNFWDKIQEPGDRDWGTWFPVPLRAEALPGGDDGPRPCLQTHGLVGIVSTPVIDPATNTMYVVYRTGLPLDLELSHHTGGAVGATVAENTAGTTRYRADARFWLAKVDIRNGRLLARPVQVSAPNFVASMQLNRPALLLDRGIVYIAFGGAVCDSGGNPYQPDAAQVHGWVFAYDAATFKRNAVFATATGLSNGVISGIWQSGNGLASDSQGNVYAFTGNNNLLCDASPKPAPCPATDYSESILRLSPSGQFDAPDHYRVREADDLDRQNSDGSGRDGDLGAGGPVLVFDDLLVGGGKQGVLYSMHNPAGQWPPPVDEIQAFFNTWINNPPPPVGCDPRIISAYGEQTTGPNMHGTPVVFKPAGQVFAFIYAMPEKDYLRQYKVTASGGSEHCPTKTTEGPYLNYPVERSGGIRSPIGMPGGFLSVSANNGHDGIVWVSDVCAYKDITVRFYDRQACGDASTTDGTIPGRLMAFDALSLDLLWEDPTDNTPAAVPFAKFVPPTVAAGHVFRAAYKDKVFVYGLTCNPAVVRFCFHLNH